MCIDQSMNVIEAQLMHCQSHGYSAQGWMIRSYDSFFYTFLVSNQSVCFLEYFLFFASKLNHNDVAIES